MVRKTKSFKQATDMAVDGAFQDLVVPPRAEGDPTGQSTAIENQLAAIDAQVAATGGMPTAAAMPKFEGNIFEKPSEFPDQPGYIPEPAVMPKPVSETQVTKKLLLDRFPELKYRFN